MELIKYPILPEINECIAQSIHHYYKANEIGSFTREYLKHEMFTQNGIEVEIHTDRVNADIDEGLIDYQRVSYVHHPSHQMYDLIVHIIEDSPIMIHIELVVMKNFTEYILPVYINEIIKDKENQTDTIESIQRTLYNLTAKAKETSLREWDTFFSTKPYVWRFNHYAVHVDHIHKLINSLHHYGQKDLSREEKEFVYYHMTNTADESIKQEAIHILAGALYGGYIEWSDEQFNQVRDFGMIPDEYTPSISIRPYTQLNDIEEHERERLTNALEGKSPDEMHVIQMKDHSLTSTTYLCKIGDDQRIVSYVKFENYPYTYPLIINDTESLLAGLYEILHIHYNFEAVKELKEVENEGRA